MEIKENLGYEVNLNQNIKLEAKIQKLEKENLELKQQMCVQSLKLKNCNHG